MIFYALVDALGSSTLCLWPRLFLLVLDCFIRLEEKHKRLNGALFQKKMKKNGLIFFKLTSSMILEVNRKKKIAKMF